MRKFSPLADALAIVALTVLTFLCGLRPVAAQGPGYANPAVGSWSFNIIGTGYIESSKYSKSVVTNGRDISITDSADTIWGPPPNMEDPNTRGAYEHVRGAFSVTWIYTPGTNGQGPPPPSDGYYYHCSVHYY